MAQLSDDCFAFGGPMMSVDEAVAIIASRVKPVGETEAVALVDADGRILSHDVAAPLPLPPFMNSAVDGYAMSGTDLPASGERAFPVAGRVQAGAPAPPALPGQAVRIFTGAPMPDGTDTVFMQEDVRIDDAGNVVLPSGLKTGANVRPAGEDIPRGHVALASGRRLRPQDVAVAAAFGLTTLDVVRRLRVGVFSTGDGLAAPGSPRADAQLFDSNRFMLMAMLRRLGCEVGDLGILRDERAELAAALKQDGGDADTLIRHADAAMYQSKRDRRGPVRLYSPELAHNASTFLGTESRLRKALKAGEFTVFYQSKVDLDSGEVVSLEALARWRDPQLGLLAPAEFIPLAEETGLILPLGDLILDQVCRQVSAWRVQGIAVPVAVNISVRQFADADFCGRVERIAHAAGCPLSMLELEVTEQVLLEDVPGAIAKLGRLRAGGISVALDDFGTGYSSAYLRNLPIDVVKVDRSFIHDVSRSARNQAILRALM